VTLMIVPEPGLASLLAVGALSFLRRRRQGGREKVNGI
jgi:hypothetical protein